MSLPGYKAIPSAAPGHSDGVLTRGAIVCSVRVASGQSPWQSPSVGKTPNELINFEESVLTFHASKGIGPMFRQFQAIGVDDYVVFQRILGLIIVQFMFPNNLEFITTSCSYNIYRSVVRIIEQGT